MLLRSIPEGRVDGGRKRRRAEEEDEEEEEEVEVEEEIQCAGGSGMSRKEWNEQGE